MRNLKLRYILELVSNIDRQAKTDAQVLAAAQQKIQGALQNTTGKFGLLERAMLRLNGLSGAGITRQSQYLAKLANNALLAQQRLERVGKGIAAVGRAGMAIGAGAMAAGYVLREPVRDAISYDRRLAGMANTAFADQGVAGRIAGMKRLEAAVTAARMQGGGTREQAAEALDFLIASGAFDNDQAMQMLPGLMRASTASGASAVELATIALRAKQTFGIEPDALPQILSAAMQAGQEGGFELRDMARWLPEQMAMAANLGLKNKDDFARLAAWNQAAVITAGSKDAAGNNLKDLLNELNTSHFKGFIAQHLLNGGQVLGRGERADMLKKVDDIFLGYQGKGVNKIDATIDLMGKMLEKNAQYQELQAKLQQTDAKDTAAQQAIYEAMAAQMQGSAIGKIFHNQQSLMAFLALLNNRQYTDAVYEKVRGEYSLSAQDNAIGTAYQVMASTTGFKTEQAEENKRMAEKAALDNLTPAIGKVADGFSDLAVKNPELAGALMLATKAATAFAMAAGMSSLMTGGKTLGGLGGLAGKLGTGLAAGKSLLGGSALAGSTTVAGALAGTLAAGAVGYGVGTLINKQFVEGTAFGDKIGQWGAHVMAAFGSEEARDALRANGHARTGNKGAAASRTVWTPYQSRAFDPARAMTPNQPFDPLRTVALTAPRQAPQQLASGKNTEIKLGQGKLDIHVLINDQLTRVNTAVTQQMPMVQVAAGGTNPGGYSRSGA